MLQKRGYDITDECMAGSVHQTKDGTVFVKWYDKSTKKRFKIYRDRLGNKFYHRKQAQKTLGQMQGDIDRGVFDILAYTKRVSNAVQYLDDWYKITESELSPATAKCYKGYIENHLKPFFQKNFIQLHEIRLSHITLLLQNLKSKKSTELSGKMKFNIISCLHTCLDYAWRDGVIQSVPPFPKKRAYQMQEPTIKWLPEERQLKVFDHIPHEHQPIFQFLRLHARRPGEAIALHRADYNNGIFTICRSLSARKVVDLTKTKKAHIIPLVDEFEQYLYQALKSPIVSQFLFTNHTSRLPGKRYSGYVLNRIWKKACEKAGENIDMYSGLKHSRGCQLINEYGLSLGEVQEVMDHADIRSTAKYAQTEIARKKELMSGRVIRISGQKVVKKQNHGT